MTHKLTIPGTLPGLNDYTAANRTNRYAAASMKKRAQTHIGWSIAKHLRNIHITQPVNIKFMWYEPNRKRDKDNIAFAKKFIIDALVNAKVLPNDGWKNVESFSDDFGVDKDDPRVEVEIRTVGVPRNDKVERRDEE